VKENDLKPEDIAAVKIRACRRESIHTTTLAKKYPRNGESADHSAFYANALAIKERSFGPDSFRHEKFTDETVLDLIEKITVETDPSYPSYSFSGASEITTKDGRFFQKQVAMPHGFGNDPLTDQELEDKFSEMASKYMPQKQIKKIFDSIWNLEKMEDIGWLASLMVPQNLK
jgi:2-methylcitrate dehydratase PrpD